MPIKLSSKLRNTVLQVVVFSVGAMLTPVLRAESYLLVRLNDISTGGDRQMSVPKISVPGHSDCCSPERDPATGDWRLKLRVNQKELITPYVVSVEPPHDDIIAIRLEFPSALERENQKLVLQPPRIKSADEKEVRAIWYSHTIAQDKNKPQVQLDYLQDLYFIVKQQRQASKSPTRVSASRLRAAFLLLSVVRNLAENTWYVVNEEYDQVIAFATDLVKHANANNLACDWLGRPSCDQLSAQITAMNRLPGTRLGKIYKLIVPDHSSLDRAFCDDMRVANLKNYHDYLSSVINNVTAVDIRTGSGTSEVRVATAIAACSVSRASCPTRIVETEAVKELDDALGRLEGAKEVYKDPKASIDADRRIVEVKHMRSAIAAGQPVTCAPR